MHAKKKNPLRVFNLKENSNKKCNKETRKLP